jgi:thioredoxin reductase
VRTGLAPARRAWVSDHRPRPALEDPEQHRSWPLKRDTYFLESSEPGVFFAGDVRHGSVKRLASAVGEGAMAAQLLHGYFAEQAKAAKAAPLLTD